MSELGLNAGARVTEPMLETGWGEAVRRWPQLTAVLDTCTERLGRDFHGDAERWHQALARLPDAASEAISLADTVTVGRRELLEQAQQEDLVAGLMALRPWRKGPFCVFGTTIETEWRSDWKWQRIADAVGRLDGQCVLDVGAGNGYFGWRMLEAGAAAVLGVDPTILFNLQHLAMRKYLAATWPGNLLLPLRVEELPDRLHVDTVFSLGVIYHQRDPRQHLRELGRHLRHGGRLFIESLIVDEKYGPALVPDGRYARMRNVHALPTVETLQLWLVETGFRDPQLIDVTPTTIDEQRRTEWMTFDSLREALDPADAGLTVEGLPAPVRACLTARRET